MNKVTFECSDDEYKLLQNNADGNMSRLMVGLLFHSMHEPEGVHYIQRIDDGTVRYIKKSVVEVSKRTYKRNTK